MRGWQEENPLGGAPGEDPQAWGAGEPTLGALGVVVIGEEQVEVGWWVGCKLRHLTDNHMVT